MTREELKQKAQSLPLSPGVYIMMNEAGEVIYVGKSRALKNRVSQYFANLAAIRGRPGPWSARSTTLTIFWRTRV